jgi:hypothetical protein
MKRKNDADDVMKMLSRVASTKTTSAKRSPAVTRLVRLSDALGPKTEAKLKAQPIKHLARRSTPTETQDIGARDGGGLNLGGRLLNTVFDVARSALATHMKRALMTPAEWEDDIRTRIPHGVPAEEFRAFVAAVLWPRHHPDRNWNTLRSDEQRMLELAARIEYGIAPAEEMREFGHLALALVA